MQEYIREIGEFLLKAREICSHRGKLPVADIPPDPSNLAASLDDSASCGLLKDIEHELTQTPGIHEEILETHRIGEQTKPEEVGVKSRVFRPDRPEVVSPGRDFKVHDLFNTLAIRHAMDEAADTAGSLSDIHVFRELPLRDQGLQPPVYVSD